MSFLTRFILRLIRAYHFFSAFFPRHCRFYPSCSVYAESAIEKFGLRQGGILAVRRLFRCHPGHPGGYDPLP